ncbi:MAG: SDR family NAD(P)-dependent oxidoreductase [Bdellovibrio sp.]|nr:SDR family NAD(P)-dependent oxidoreductase [Bdellovibrio sp.]
MSSRVLVTGADGFIGSHLAELLVQKGFQVRALTVYNSMNSWGWLDHSSYAKDMEIVSGDIRDPFLCQSICEGVDIVFNLAALIAIPYSYVAPQSYVETNVTGTLNMCQAALKNKVQKFIQTSTSEVYGTARYVPIDEKHPLQPQSPYSASKIGSDSMAMSYHNSFSLPVCVARPFNTYGPRQSARAVIPTIISQLANGYKEINLGDVTPTRDFNFVKDTCSGLLALTETDKTNGQTINIGSQTEISIEETFNLIQKLMNTKASLKTDQSRIRPQNSEVFRLVCDNTLIKSMTSFSPQFNIEKGLAETIEWFTNSENLKKYKADRYNV